MSIIKVKTSGEYDVKIERGLISRVGETLGDMLKSRKILIITDDIVESLYLKKVTKNLEKYSVFTFPNGEKSKNIHTLSEIYATAARENITRSDLIIALGGGVVGDIAGYAAATWLRGIDYVQIPTTLLAQIDSSVGGKTAIDIPEGKNLVGAFKQPKMVICDPDTLKTLPENILADGVGEAIKYGMIKDAELFAKLKNHNIGNIFEIIYSIIERCVEIKRDVVEADEFEKGERMLLNFGHTLGHAVEKLSNFSVSHGSAVAIGMCLITKKYAPCLTNGLEECIMNYLLPVSADFSVDELINVTKLDKKRSGDSIRFIVCEKIGFGEIRCEKVKDFFR
jgi:3-dehydroquinate synthase